LTGDGAPGSASLDGAMAVVTGASRGIGEAVARSLVSAGAVVALVARSRDALEALAAALGPRAFAVPCDLRDAAAVSAAGALIGTTLGGPPRILVNNAGIFRVAPIHELAPEEFESMVAVNLVAPFRFIRAFLPAMTAAKAGHIVTIGSIADRFAIPGNAGYSATKYGVRAMHEVLRAEARGSGVRATLVSPSATDTAIWDGIELGKKTRFPERAQMLRAEDVARAVMFAVMQPEGVNVDEVRLSRG
jgi:NADP-dependent 3-hydroxy acid dehydrogenase YdfG